MRRYFFRNHQWLTGIYPGALWKIPAKEKVLYLTFDDGPHERATPFVLDCLDRFQAKATFFCIGEQAARYPELVKELSNRGHAIGNHTFSHMNGWKTDKERYLQDVYRCEQILAAEQVQSGLFRPPYGNLRGSQLRALREADFQVVMWSHLSGDFDPQLNVQRSLRIMKRAGSGSILLFHDSEKAFQNLQLLLSEVLAHFTSLGFSFKTLNQR